jgi:hypothetical protein
MRILRSIVAPSTAFMAFCDPKGIVKLFDVSIPGLRIGVETA